MSSEVNCSSCPRGQIVKPENPPDRTLATTVFGLVHDVIPQPSSTTGIAFEKIEWVSFESCDLNDPCWRMLLGNINGNETPLVVIGLATGYHIWAVMSNGESEELLSVREGPVKVVKFLPSVPFQRGLEDKNSDKRPLIAVCGSISAGRQFCSVSIQSLRTGDTIASLKHNEPIYSIAANANVIVVSLARRLVAYNARTFTETFRIENCALAEGHDANPFALGHEWLAYADSKLNSSLQSCGGVCNVDVQSYTLAMLSVAKNLGKNLQALSGQVVSLGKGPQVRRVKGQSESSQTASTKSSMITVISVTSFSGKYTDIHSGKSHEGVVVHFPAHLDESISTLAFNPNGQLLLTADVTGHQFHVFSILPHPAHPALAAVHHLYTLNRGNTAALVQNVSFSLDSRWAAVTTFHGTTHIYPITPYGGPVNIRTHASPKVVNRQSRFHRSAGLENLEPCRTPPSPPHLSGGSSPSGKGSPTIKEVHPSVSAVNASGSCSAMNPRLPPYPLPLLLSAVTQLKQMFTLPIIGPAVGVSEASGSKKDHGSSSVGRARHGSQDERLTLAVCFAPSRGWNVLNPGNKREADRASCLFVINCQGELIEYTLSVKPSSAVAATKLSSETAIELKVQPAAMWFLRRSRSNGDLRPPLSDKHPFVHVQLFIKQQHEKQQNCRRNRASTGIAWEVDHDPSSMSSRRSSASLTEKKKCMAAAWFSQVEIVSYSGPHRRLWTGPQFTFKTYMDPAATAELMTPIGGTKTVGRSDPVAMPGRVPLHSIPVVIEANSGSFEQAPSLAMEVCGSWSDNDYIGCDEQDWLRQNIAEAMQDQPCDSTDCGSSLHGGGGSEVDPDDFAGLAELTSPRSLEHLRQDSSEMLFLEARESV